MRESRTRFSKIELLVVVAIIIILISIALPSLLSSN
jgi:Tfp pilus assembly protein FimT